jgi:hypothetical protein
MRAIAAVLEAAHLLLLGLGFACMAFATRAEACSALDSSPCVDLHVVAHQDDDLLFMNPDIQESITRGNRVATVFVTAGTNGDLAYLAAREQGILNAYAYMVSPSHAVLRRGDEADMLVHWRLHGGRPIAISFGGSTRRAIQYDFVSPIESGATVSVVFLRLPETNGVADVRALWNGGATNVPTVACTSGCPLGSSLASQSYTREVLIRVLAGIAAREHGARPGAPLRMSVLDSTSLHHVSEDYGLGWVEHEDHVAAANFATAAFVRYHASAGSAPRALQIYRGYNTGSEPTNLSAAEIQGKRSAFHRYYALAEVAPGVVVDPDAPMWIDTYDEWTMRKYTVISVAGGADLRGRLQNGLDQCLRANATMGPCADAPEWTLTRRNEIRSNRSCLALGRRSEVARPVACSPQAERKTLVLTSNGQVRVRGAKCLEADGAGVRAADCAKLVVGGTPLRRPTPTQDFTLLLSEPVLVTTQLGDASEVDQSRSYYRTIAIAGGEVCLRRPWGVGCARYADLAGEQAPLDGRLEAFAYWPSVPPEYTDAQGWRSDSTGATVVFRRLAAAGPLDVCGRGYYGMRCGVGPGAAWWSNEFSTTNGWARSPSYYGSIRLADVNGDGHADVCGRGVAGVHCAAGTGTAFGPAVWMTPQFSDAAGWNSSPNGETLQYGDVDGDGRDDVCGRGDEGLLCATSAAEGTAFVRDHVWTANATSDKNANTRDFSDGDPAGDWELSSAKYRTLRLVDLNRDGRADVCGRGASGIVCALSTGTAFEAKRLVLQAFTDTELWDGDRYGSTLTWGGLDGDSRVDLCGRGIDGLWCSEGY